MLNIETVKLLLIVISGVCWTIVYIDGIRVGFRDKSYAIPFYALALNFAWELLYTYHGFRINGVDAQNIFNAAWLTFDIGILYTYFRFGRKYFGGRLFNPPADAGGTDFAFLGWSVLGLVTAFAVQYAVIREFGVAKGAAYSAFPQNLIMSILFIAMLARRGSREGQTILIAVEQVGRHAGADNSLRRNRTRWLPTWQLPHSYGRTVLFRVRCDLHLAAQAHIALRQSIV